jgi:hypothetical protein
MRINCRPSGPRQLTFHCALEKGVARAEPCAPAAYRLDARVRLPFSIS